MTRSPQPASDPQCSLRLDGERLEATVELSGPRPNLAIHRALGHNLAVPVHCLLTAGQPEQPGALTLRDHYTRPGAVAAEYLAESSDTPFVLGVRWQLKPELPSGGVGLDVVTSVNSTRLHSHPTVHLTTSLRGTAAVEHLLDAAGPTWETLPDTSGRWERLAAPSSTVFSAEEELPRPSTCLVARGLCVASGEATRPSSPEAPLLFAEMSWPATAEQIAYSRRGDTALWRRDLFDLSLEKGVILRVRTRLAWFPAAAGEEAVIAAYRELAAEPPPLET